MKALQFCFLAAIIILLGCKKTTTDMYPSVPPDSGPVAVSSQDRVYTADQSSNTVSVIDPSTDKLLGVIRFGSGRPNDFSPLYTRKQMYTEWAFHRTMQHLL